MGFLFYKSHKSSSISLPKELENIKMNAFTENLNNASNSIKDIFTFEDNINIPHLKTENDILVKVHSASLNQVDYIYLFSHFPFIRWFKTHFGVAMDFSGKIIQIGKNVTKFKIGDEVFGFAKEGALQEYTITNEKIIARKPIISNFNEVCGLPVCFITAYVTIIYNFGTDVKNKKF